MDTSGVTYNLIILFLLLGASAFFSASETALFSINKIRLRSLADSGNKKAIKTQKLLEKPDDLLSTILILNNLVNITTSSLMTVVMYKLLGDAGISIATGLVTILVLIFGEITPKNIAVKNSEKISLLVSGIMETLIKILKPISCLFRMLADFINKLAGGSETGDQLTEDDLKSILNVGEENGVLNLSEKEMIYNVFDFGDLLVKDVMVQKTNIAAIDINSTYADVMSIIKKEKYSRFPIYKDNIDTIVGILNIKDLILEEIKESSFELKNYIRDVSQTYEFKDVHILFKEMKKTKNHMFIVLDEYGITKGIVTMEDLVEEIVGDIDDEYDTLEDREIVKINENKFIVSGSAKIEVVAESIGVDIVHKEDDFDSVGGFFIKEFDGFPKKNDYIEVNNLKFKIIEVNKKTIKKVEIEKI